MNRGYHDGISYVRAGNAVVYDESLELSGGC
jgi:hypothetical protein